MAKREAAHGEETWRDALQAGERVGSGYALAPPRRVSAGFSGVQLADRPGSSIEFMDYRAYQPGDDLRRIDWSAYGRSDRLMVKMYHEEVSPHVDLVIDGSRSMALAGTAKREATLALAGCLAMAAANSGYGCAAWLASERFEPINHAAPRPSRWEVPAFDGDRSVGRLLEACGPPWRGRTLRVLISDLLWPEEPTMLLRRLGERAAGLVVVQMLAAEDVQPPETGHLRLIDSETGQWRELVVDASMRQRYLENLHAHQARWAEATRAVGAVMHRMVAESLLEAWDLRPLVESQVLRVK